jgi:D-psicose/D-tagatose/L-ribulose 3-epimerase
MDLAIHNWMKAESLETTLRRISDLGYPYIEIQGSPELYDINEVKHLLQKYGVKCWGSVTLMLDQRNLVAKDDGQRAKSVQYVKDIVDMVAALDGSMVSVVPGTVGKIIPDGRPEQEWEWAVESMKKIYQYSESKGITIGIEPINRFETYFINRADQALALAEATGPNCGVCLDVFHMNIEEEDLFEALKRAKDRLVGVHVADNNRMAPGMGHLNWQKIVDTLKEINYDKVLSVEFCAPLDRTPANPYPNSIDQNPSGLSADQKKFLEDHGSAAVTEEFYYMLTKKSIETLRPLILS